MTIVRTTESDGSEYIRLDGESIVAFTPQTPKDGVSKFVELAVAHESELMLLMKRRQVKIDWNMAHPGQGRNWPEFREYERLVGRLAKQAGIKDT